MLLVPVFYLRSQRVEPTPTIPQPTITIVGATTPIELPLPKFTSSSSLEAVLKTRRTIRDFQDKPLDLQQVSQLLWATQGVTVDLGGRTVPSAKSVYPLTVYLVAFNVDKLEAGLYRYVPGKLRPAHELIPVIKSNLRDDLSALVNQTAIQEAPAILVITGDFAKMREAFGDKDVDYNVYLEAGHAAQNLALQATALALGSVTITTLDRPSLQDTLEIPVEESIIYLIPIGLPKN